MLPLNINASLRCSYNSALKILVLSLVKGRGVAGIVSPPELSRELALKSGGILCQSSHKVATK